MLRIIFVLAIALGITLASIWSDRNSAHSADESSFAQLVVLDPPPRFVVQARRLGYTVSEPQFLTDLKMMMFRVTVPPGKSPDSIAAVLREKFPGLVVDQTSLVNS